MAAWKQFLKGPTLVMVVGFVAPFFILFCCAVVAASLGAYCVITSGSASASTCTANVWVKDTVDLIFTSVIWGPLIWLLSIFAVVASFILSANDLLKERVRK